MRKLIHNAHPQPMPMCLFSLREQIQPFASAGPDIELIIGLRNGSTARLVGICWVAEVDVCNFALCVSLKPASSQAPQGLSHDVACMISLID